MYQKKSLEELNVLDNFLISAVAADREVGETFCRTMLSVLLEREIGNIRVHAQQFVSALTPTLRGIRMDVEVEEVEEADGEGVNPIVSETSVKRYRNWTTMTGWNLFIFTRAAQRAEVRISKRC